MVTFTGQLLSLFSKNTPGIKRLGSWSMASGSVGLFRFEDDGNAYEVVIRPDSLGEFKDLYGDMIKKKIDRPGFIPNKDEPLSMQNVIEIITGNLQGLYHKVTSLKNDKNIYRFKITFFNNIDISKIESGIKSLEEFNHFEIANINLSGIQKYAIINYIKTI